MDDGVWKGVYFLIFGRSGQLLENKVFDPSSPSMKKGRDRGGKKGGETGEKENKDVFSGH